MLQNSVPIVFGSNNGMIDMNLCTRFILKQMSRFECQSFTEFAPNYFKVRFKYFSSGKSQKSFSSLTSQFYIPSACYLEIKCLMVLEFSPTNFGEAIKFQN